MRDDVVRIRAVETEGIQERNQAMPASAHGVVDDSMRVMLRCAETCNLRREGVCEKVRSFIIIIIIIIIIINCRWVYTRRQCATMQGRTIQYNTIQYNTNNTHHTE
jgi:hypothetical protein